MAARLPSPLAALLAIALIVAAGAVRAAPATVDPARADAARFLTQAGFGPTLAEIDALAGSGDYAGWLEAQRSAPVCLEFPRVLLRTQPFTPDQRVEAWTYCAVRGADQLRQRMALALSEILTVSDRTSSLAAAVLPLSDYHDLLARGALGNYRDLLDAVTLSPVMATYLTLVNSNPVDNVHHTHPDENYARELMQLFTLGVQRLNLDGSLQLGDDGKPLTTYSQKDVENLARVFTGWGWSSGWGATMPQFGRPLTAYESHHDRGIKNIVGGVRLPSGSTVRDDLEHALDAIFAHPNVAPFISRELIQRLVTSNPSPGYIERVARVFEDNGAGVRGDLYAVACAILLDAEARDPASAADPGFGKLREPLVRVAQLWRAFEASAPSGRFDVTALKDKLAEAPLQASSVFGFFRPDFQPGGPLKDSDLVAPEFQITDEASMPLASNFYRAVSQRFRDASGAGSYVTLPADIALSFGPWAERSLHTGPMLDDLNVLLMSGQMSATTWQTLYDYVSTYPDSSSLYRLSEAIGLIALSPQYSIQR
jgi:uncharacterized protein (DUF1800 family)